MLVLRRRVSGLAERQHVPPAKAAAGEAQGEIGSTAEKLQGAAKASSGEIMSDYQVLVEECNGMLERVRRVEKLIEVLGPNAEHALEACAEVSRGRFTPVMAAQFLAGWLSNDESFQKSAGKLLGFRE